MSAPLFPGRFAKDTGFALSVELFIVSFFKYQIWKLFLQHLAQYDSSFLLLSELGFIKQFPLLLWSKGGAENQEVDQSLEEIQFYLSSWSLLWNTDHDRPTFPQLGHQLTTTESLWGRDTGNSFSYFFQVNSDSMRTLLILYWLFSFSEYTHAYIL